VAAILDEPLELMRDPRQAITGIMAVCASSAGCGTCVTGFLPACDVQDD